jgi:type II secretory ATPase GspE/PulE/Tfp pilus assembly ATPase PilB-like protein
MKRVKLLGLPSLAGCAAAFSDEGRSGNPLWRLGDAIRDIMVGKREPEEPAPEPPVELAVATNGDTQASGIQLAKARQLPGFDGARWMIADALLRRSQLMTLDCRYQTVSIRYLVDGIWHKGVALERGRADSAMEALKTLCGIDLSDSESRQRGRFAADYQSTRYQVTLASQATKTGQRVAMQFAGAPVRFETLDDIGLRPELQDRVRAIVNEGTGILLLSAVPSGGLRTTTEVLLNGVDRLTREVISIEEENNRYRQVEAVDIRTYSAAGGESPANVLRWVFDIDPAIVVLRDLVNRETVDRLCDLLSPGKRLVISTIRARDCVEALFRVLMLKVNRAKFVEQVTAVLNQRLIRKLCDACKEPYTPSPQVVEHLGVPTGQIESLYRPPQNGEQPCPECGGIGYRGGTALFEMFELNDSVRDALISTPELELVRQAARNSGMRSLQDEGLLMVARGTTSLAELSRVVKQFRSSGRRPAASV